MTLWCVEVGPVANAREGSTQEHDIAREQFIFQERLGNISPHSRVIKWSLPQKPSLQYVLQWWGI